MEILNSGIILKTLPMYYADCSLDGSMDACCYEMDKKNQVYFSFQKIRNNKCLRSTFSTFQYLFETRL